jgi:hypothetical protein
MRSPFLRRRSSSLAAILALSALVLSAGGCRRSLFSSDEGPRTQFETHDRMRQRYVEPVEWDVFGNPQPALRARLSANR